MRGTHLLPLLTLLPFVLGVIIVTQLNVSLDPITVAIIAIGYILINALYAAYRHTFQIHTLVEFSLVALIAYFALTQSV